MTVQLTEAQMEALDRDPGAPVSMLDPRTNALWMLVSASDYEIVQQILEEERQQKAIRAVGRRNAIGRMNEAE